MQAPQQADLIIRAGYILAMDEDLNVFQDHCLAVKDGKIAAIYPAWTKMWTAPETIDAPDSIVIPALINTHTHLPMTYFRGLADDLPLDVWLHKYIWPIEARVLNDEVIRDAALHGACEMIKNGIGMAHDMYFNMRAVADACSQAGMRALIGEAVIEARRSGNGAPGSLIAEHKAHYASDPLIDFNLCPHSIYACSRATLELCVEAAQMQDLLLHIHLSETEQEALNCLKDNGKRPVHYLEELGMLELPLLLAHAIWVDDDELDLLASKAVSIASCTDSNLKLGSGILPLKAYLDRKINVSLATDGVASNNDLDLLSELGNTARLHKTITKDPSFLPASEALKLVTINAAKALGVEHLRGSLEVGKDADICILGLDDLQCQPLYNPYSHVVYAMGSKHVRHMIIAGRQVLKDGRLTQVDEGELIAKAKSWESKIKAELKQ